MAGRAVAARLDVKLFLHCLAVSKRQVSEGVEREIGDLADWAQIVGRIAVALKAPAHGERRLLIDDFHRVNATVAADAADAAIHMRAVIEVREVRQLVHARPLDRKSSRNTLTKRRQLRAFWMNLRVTVHASLRRRNRSVRGLLNAGVAVAAVQAEFASVQRVAVRNGLHGLIANLKRLGTEAIRNEKRRVQRDSHAGKDDGRQQQVGPSRKEESTHGLENSETRV